jgi:hypothetical protein
MKKVLVLLTSVVTLTAIAGGFLLIMDPAGSSSHLSTEALRNSPFKDYLMPGILLLALVGGINGIALICQLTRAKGLYGWTIAGATVLLAWTVFQMLIFAETSWLQFFFLFTAGFMILLTWQIKGKWAA